MLHAICNNIYLLELLSLIWLAHLKQFFGASLLARNSHFLACKTVFISPSLPELILARYRVWVWEFFSFSTVKMYHSFLPSVFLMRNHPPLELLSPMLHTWWCSFFQKFFIVFSFQQFNYYVCGQFFLAY